MHKTTLSVHTEDQRMNENCLAVLRKALLNPYGITEMQYHTRYTPGHCDTELENESHSETCSPVTKVIKAGEMLTVLDEAVSEMEALSHRPPYDMTTVQDLTFFGNSAMWRRNIYHQGDDQGLVYYNNGKPEFYHVQCEAGECLFVKHSAEKAETIHVKV